MRSTRLDAITPRDVRGWYEVTLADRPTLRSHCYSLLRTVFASAITEELIDANPCRITGAGRSRRVHRNRPASVEELAALTEAMPPRLALMVTPASWCALRFGEIVELRRGDIDLGAEVIRIRRAAVRTRGAYSVTSPKSDAGVRDVDIPPHIIPAIEDDLAKYVGSACDSLIFPAEGGGHLQPSTLYRHWYKARNAAGRDDLHFHDLRHSGAVSARLVEDPHLWARTLYDELEDLGFGLSYQSLTRNIRARGLRPDCEAGRSPNGRMRSSFTRLVTKPNGTGWIYRTRLSRGVG